MIKSLHWLTFILLLTITFSYLQLQIYRYQLKNDLKNKSIECITKQIDKQLVKKKKQQVQQKKKKKNKKNNNRKTQQQQQFQQDQSQALDQDIDDDQITQQKNYQQICYQKDITYTLPMYLKDQLQMIALDTTIPISWFKGSNCHIQGTSKKCTPIVDNIKQKIVKIFKKKVPKVKHNSQQYAMIQGSSQLVKGIQQKVDNFSFITKDSSRLTSLLQLLMLGFYMKGQKDTLVLQTTNFINATEISQNLNYLCDGAISLRFDDMSQKSFIKQLIDFQHTTDKYVSFYLKSYGNGAIAIGQTASKYSKNGFGGLEWITIENDQKYGKLPTITDIIIQNQVDNGKSTIADIMIQNQRHSFSEIKQKQYPAVISLSASYIGIPKQVMAQWLKKFNKKSNCQVNNITKYLECKPFKTKQQSKIITFAFKDTKISFKLSDLILGKRGGKIIINMKQTLHDTYAILGQPFFNKYLVVFDYNNNKVGIGQKNDKDDKDFINVISLVRFICFVFFIGCGFILCFLPIKRCIQLIKSKVKYGNKQGNKGETRRLKQYSPIQDNPYDQLSSKIKQAIGTQESH